MSLLTKALNFAAHKHLGQMYSNGEPYLSHPREVYRILKQLTDDENLLAAALLHDTLEDTNTTHEELVTEFNQDIADLVREVTKDSYNTFPQLKTKRGIMLKFADRLCNLSHMENWPEAKQQRYLDKSKFWKGTE